MDYMYLYNIIDKTIKKEIKSKNFVTKQYANQILKIKPVSPFKTNWSVTKEFINLLNFLLSAYTHVLYSLLQENISA